MPTGRRSVNWSELASLVDVLLDAPPEQRASIIEEMSAGDEVRRVELERLLEECEREPTLLGRPAAERFAALLEVEVPDFPASLAERYRLARELGRGGMATVYLVHDLKHDRQVALKVLHRELAAALGPDRFLREIRIAAGLHHPLILPVFDSGSSPGASEAAPCLWYTMPFVEGESLRDRLGRESQLPIDEAVRIGCEVADALGYAHARGVIHRDVKPENILLSGSHALLADFGIARALDMVGEGRLTETGLSLGTPAYMSPEQAAGDNQLDCRADLYSLACVLYEMLAGQLPFTGSSPRAIMARHAIDPVPSLRTVRSTVPAGLEAAIRRALCKVPADRFASAADLVEALNRGARGSGVEPFPGQDVTRVVVQNVDVPLPSPRVETASVALVGRTEEWERLIRVWFAGRHDPPRCLLISGVAGIGKTRLAEEFVRWADGQSTATATSRCYGTVGRLPYAPLADWLRSRALGDSLSRLPRVWRAEIAGLLPEVGIEASDSESRKDIPQAEARHRLFEAMVRTIRGAPHPLLLFIDDIQWADRDTLEWIRYFLRSEDPLWVLVVATLRLGEVPLEDRLEAVLLDLRRDGRLEEIMLEPLTLADTAALGGAIAGVALEPSAAQALHRETEGHPLYIVEMMRSKAASGDDAILFMGASARRASGGFGPRQSLPQRVLATIEARLAQLSPACRTIVGVASVIGRAFRMDLLAEGSGVDENEVAAALDELLERRLVREQSDGSYDFSHASIREVAYAGLSSGRRRLLHQRIARALIAAAAGSTSSAAGIATHLEQGGLIEEAVAYYRLAAEHARDLFAGAETVFHFEKALELLQELPTSAARLGEEIEVRTALCVALAPLEMFSGPRLLDQYGRVRALCGRTGITPSPRLLRTLAIAFVIRGEISEAAKTGEQLLAAADKIGNPVLFVEAQYVLGVTAAWAGDPTGATRHFEAALEAYRPEDAHQHITFGQDPSAICGVRLAQVLWMNGRTEPARQTLAKALDRAQLLGHPYTLTYVRQHSAWVLLDLGDYTGARHQIDSAIELAEANAFSGWSIRNRALHGFLLTHEGQPDRGIILMRSAAEEWASRGFRLFVPYDRALLAQACLAVGRLEEGFRALEEGTAVARETGQLFWDAELLRLTGELLAASGAPASEVRRLLLEAGAVAKRQSAVALVRRAEGSLQRLR